MAMHIPTICQDHESKCSRKPKTDDYELNEFRILVIRQLETPVIRMGEDTNWVDSESIPDHIHEEYDVFG